MAGARALWRATGMKTEDFLKPVVAIANSFTQFVPGHVHLHPIGQRVKQVIDAAGGYGVEFNTIAVDDGIAMGHDGMLYSLPSRELIADSVEYMVNAPQGRRPRLHLQLRQDHPRHAAGRPAPQPADDLRLRGTHGGRPRAALHRAGQARSRRLHGRRWRRPAVSDEELEKMEAAACPTCGSCSGMFTANSMNCLNEAIGLALPGNGTVLATHRAALVPLRAGPASASSRWPQAYYRGKDSSVLPRSIATFEAFENAMSLDIAMGGSTNTVLHLLAMAREAGVDFTMADIDPPVAPGALHLQGGAGVAGVPRGGRGPRRRHPPPSWESCSGPASSTPGRAPSPAAPWAT